MSKTDDTIQLEKTIRHVTHKMGTFGCSEVTIGFGGKERVDYMTYDTTGIFRCYEIKVTKSDFRSKNKHSFVGHYNYFVVTKELYDQIKDEIPDWVGCYAGECCVKKPKKQDIDNKEYITHKTIKGKSTQVSMPWTEMLKDSLIRSLARDSQKLFKEGDKNFIDRTNRQIARYEKIIEDYAKKYDSLYLKVKSLIGNDALELLYDNAKNTAKLYEIQQKILEVLKSD